MTLPLALTMGEPAGIGPEITIKAWRALRRGRLRFFVIGDPACYGGAPVAVIDRPSRAARIFGRALPVLDLGQRMAAKPGKPNTQDAAGVIASIRRAVELAQSGAIAGLVTNPINKHALYQAGFRHAGHTDFIAAMVGQAGDEIMMLAVPGLRVVPVTIHVALKHAIAQLTTPRVVKAGRVLAQALRRDFAIARPRIAVAGLNPHAGEDGAMGNEDRAIVAPAVRRLVRAGIDAVGPLPPDTMFHAAARAGYDAALCMYHDQALIPLKTIDFARGVNVTLGLPIVRTSPDHGTAFDIAGQDRADPTSLIEAIKLAATIARNRA